MTDQHILSLPPQRTSEPSRWSTPVRDHPPAAPQRPDRSYVTLAQPFEAQAARTPVAIALQDDDGTLTYQQLDEASNRLAGYLQDAGARPGCRVALLAERSLPMVVGLYATVKTGATYVPIDPDLSNGRIGWVLGDAAPVLVLTDDQSRHRVPGGPWQVVSLNEPGRWNQRRATAIDPTKVATRDAFSHLLYTSGATGTPKVVAGTAESAIADILSLQTRYPYRLADVTLLKTSYACDTSLWELFWPLFFGARLVICPPAVHANPERLIELINKHRATTIYLSPTVLQAVIDAMQPGSCRSLRWVLSGREPVTPQLRDSFCARFAARLVNG